MITVLIGAAVLIIVSAGLSLIVGSAQRTVIGYQGNLTDSAELKITGAGTPSAAEMAKSSGGAIPGGESKSVASKGAQISAAVEQTDFGSMGGAQPLAQYTTTYLLGDDLYDESYSLDTPSGELMGEVGISISESVDWDDQKNVIGFELWLFDMADASTSSKVIVTSEAIANDSIRDRLSPRGELVIAAPGTWISVDGPSLRVRLRIIDSTIKTGSKVPDIVFEHLTMEIAVWQNDGQPMPDLTAKAQEAQSAGTAKNEQRIKTNYLIRYPKRLYKKKPFTLQVSVPGELDDETRKKVVGKKAAGAEKGSAPVIAFTHKAVQTGAQTVEMKPATIGVALAYDQEEFQIPVATQTTELGYGVTLDFSIKPLKSESLLLAVNFYHVNDVMVEEQQLEVVETRDRITGDVTSIATKKVPAHMTRKVDHLGSESMSIEVRSFLGMGPGGLRFFKLLIGLLLIGAYLAAMFVLELGDMDDMIQVGIAGGGSLIAFLMLLMLGRGK